MDIVIDWSEALTALMWPAICLIITHSVVATFGISNLTIEPNL